MEYFLAGLLPRKKEQTNAWLLPSVVRYPGLTFFKPLNPGRKNLKTRGFLEENQGFFYICYESRRKNP